MEPRRNLENSRLFVTTLTTTVYSFDLSKNLRTRRATDSAYHIYLCNWWIFKRCETPCQSLCNDAWKLRRALQVSHWDATIIASAQNLGCVTLYSEDMSHGQNYGGVRVNNPLL